MSRRAVGWMLVGVVSTGLATLCYFRWHGGRRFQSAGGESSAVLHYGETPSRYAALSPQAKDVADRMTDASHREFAIAALWASEQPTLRTRDLAPFIDALERAGVPRDLAESQAGVDTTQVMQSLMTLTDAWVDGGPYPELQGQLTRLAGKFHSHPDHWVRVYSASVLLVIRDHPTSQLGPTEERFLGRLLAEQTVREAAERYAAIAYSRAAQAGGGK